MTLDLTSYSVFAVLAGLVLLVGVNHASPGCTGPAVERCDYIETAKAANSGPYDREFSPDLGFNVFDQGSAVWVQQSYPIGAMTHASAVIIDKKSCRPCETVVYGHLPPPIDRRDVQRGRLIQSTPAQNLVEAERFRIEYERYGHPINLDQGTSAERR